MTLAPDHIGYHNHQEEGAGTVHIFPTLRDPAQAPGNAPEGDELDRAVDVILWHLADGWANGDDELVTYAHVVTDLDRPINLRAFLTLTRDHTETCDQHGTDWPTDTLHDYQATVATYLRDHGYTRIERKAA